MPFNDSPITASCGYASTVDEIKVRFTLLYLQKVAGSTVVNNKSNVKKRSPYFQLRPFDQKSKSISLLMLGMVFLI
ncbi:hypothetical protein L1987_33666 [Smallanthus sonchifolius]|uniref:Uncharacterized protein n=1 Tax=Smallanthus sonchifolius TaxID=185202 RepID=A0ACB9HSV9_9ASTR|nr:hypothetical protein L1987_33666 [Smallanthus sonchifolius]